MRSLARGLLSPAAAYLGSVECQNRSVEGEADRTSGKNSRSRFHYTQSGSIGVDKGKGPVDQTVVYYYTADSISD